MENNHDLNPISSEKSLIKFHKGLIIKCIKDNTSWDLRKRNLILKIYDNEIDEENIRHYINANLILFLKALITDRLSEIKSYYIIEQEA